MNGIDLYRLDGRVAVVTGAARGIGETIARHLAQLGARVVLADRNPQVAETAARLSAEGATTLSLTLDVTDPASLADAVSRVLEAYGQIDILVANAGVSYERAAIDHTVEDWRNAMSANLDGTFYTVQAFARPMLEQRRGSIVMLSSIAGVKVVRPEKHVGYDVAKAGVAHMARVLGVDWAPSGLRVNAVGPGYTDTEMLADVGRAHPEVMEKWIEDMPIGRLLRREEIAATIGFLVSDAASGITGHVLMADGGYSVS